MDGFGSGDRGYKREAGGGAVTLGCSAPQAGDLHLKTGRRSISLGFLCNESATTFSQAHTCPLRLKKNTLEAYEGHHIVDAFRHDCN